MSWYKKSEKNMIISFDFDGTLFETHWNPSENDFYRDEKGNIKGGPKEDVIRMLSHYANKGIKIIITSSRYDTYKNEIEKFVNEHNLPVSDIYCTNGQDKVNILKTLGVSKHFDDDKFEIDKINQDGTLMGILV